MAQPDPVALPEGWSVRPTTSEDADDLLALVHASDMTAVGFADFSPEDVADALAGPYSEVAIGPGPAGQGPIMGWGYLENGPGGARDFIEVYVHPEGGLPAQRPLLSRLLAEVAARASRAQRAQMTARAGAIPSETAWIASLEAYGFDFLKQYARMKIDLPAPETEPAPGVAVRTAVEDDLPEFFAVLDIAFRDTPDYQPTSYERWRERFVDGHKVRFSEWLVAEVDGTMVGILHSSEQSDDLNEGWVKHLAVLPSYRKRGVGRALLARAFAAYTERGRTAAGLGVDLANPTEAIRLYTGVGMTAAYRANIYEKSISAG